MKRSLLMFVFAIAGFSVFAQTNPAAVNLPVNYTLNDLATNSTVYPAGIQGWSAGNQATKAAAEGSAPTGDYVMSTATASTSAGIYNWGQKIGPLGTGSASPQVVLAVNTTGKSGIAVSYDVYKTRENTRSNGVTLQYRVGTSGAWTTVANSDYVSGSSAVGDFTSFSNLKLGANADNQPVVQIRWIFYELGGSGSRDGLGYKNIVIDQATPDGTGSSAVSNKQWILNTSSDVKFVFKKAADALTGVKVVIPSYFSWSKSTDDVSTTTTFSIDGDSLYFTPDFSTIDSFNVTFKNLTLTTDTTLLFSWPVYSKGNGNYKLTNSLPTTLLIGSPKTLDVARGNNADGSVKNLGRFVTVRGVVTVANQYGGPSVIQDATGGLSIFSSNVSTAVTIGDEIVLVGSISQFNGLTELINATLIETISTGNVIDPLPLTIAQIKADGVNGVENYEGLLVRIKGVTVTTTTWTSGTSGTNYPMTDATGTMDLRVDNNVDFAGTPAPGSAFDVVGVLSQFVAAAPYIGGYQLLPRSKADIISSGVGFDTIPLETEMSPTSVTLSWKNSASATPGVKYGLTPAYELGKIVGNSASTSNNIELTNLTPATVYFVKPFAFVGNDTAFAPSMMIVSQSESTGKMNVYFNQSVDLTKSIGENANGNIAFSDTLVKRINGAKKSISVALYSLSGTVGAKVANALIAAKNKGVVVRVIMEEENSSTAPPNNLRNNGIAYITDKYGLNSGDGLMHNKFAVIDVDTNNPNDAWVWMGSYNTTDPGEQNDFQNVVEIQDQSLAKVYTIEFNEMWGSSGASPNSTTSRFGANKLNNTPHHLKIGNTWVESYFSPSDQVTSQIKRAILSTDYQGYVAMLSYTRDELAKAEETKTLEGKKFINLVDNNTDTGAQFTFLSSFSESYVHNVGALLHHKYLIVDHNQVESDPLVLTGSHNWSTSAETKNSENTLIFHSHRIANLFVQEFAKRYSEVGGNTTIPTAVEENNLAGTFELIGNYPNPFNPLTTLRFAIPATGLVTVEIYNLLGQKIETLVSEQIMNSGFHNVPFNAGHLSSGLYFYSVRFNGNVKTAKLILSK